MMANISIYDKNSFNSSLITDVIPPTFYEEDSIKSIVGNMILDSDKYISAIKSYADSIEETISDIKITKKNDAAIRIAVLNPNNEIITSADIVIMI